MAPIKRKSDTSGQDERPGKKPKSSAGTAFSTLKEEAPFPRGGASVLTPLEHKQIKIQAKQDVLFEQNTGKKAPRNDYVDGEIEGFSDEDLRRITESKQPKKGKASQKHKKSAVDVGRRKAIRIETLGYKACSWSRQLATVG